MIFDDVVGGVRVEDCQVERRGHDGHEETLLRDRPGGRRVRRGRHLAARVEDETGGRWRGSRRPRESAVGPGLECRGRRRCECRLGLRQQRLRTRPPEEPDQGNDGDDDDRREATDGDASSPRGVQVDRSVEVDGGVVLGLRVRREPATFARDVLVDTALGHGVAPLVAVAARRLGRSLVWR
jgi:hypothetical protein